MNSSACSDKALVSSILDEVACIPGLPAEWVASLRKKVDEHIFNVVVAGEFKRGKSTLINALLGEDVLPMGVVPLTSVVTLLRYGVSASMEVCSNDGEVQQVPLSQLAEYATERGNPSNCKHVRTVTVSHPSPWLKGGVQLVDTPGVGSVHDHNGEVTRQYLPQADAVIFVISADQPLSRNELDFLAHVRQYAGKVFCLLNKVDLLSPAELQESMAFTVGVLRKTIGVEVPAFPVSARQALNAVRSGHAGMLSTSGMANFEYALQHFLKDEGELVWVESVRRQILSGLSERALSNELELRAMEWPLEQLERSLQVFKQKKVVLAQAQEDMESLLMSDCHKLLKRRLEPDLDGFKQTLRSKLRAHLDDWAGKLRRGGTRALEQGLEQHLVDEVRNAFDAWKAEENVLIDDGFQDICARFWGHMCGHIDDLMRHAAEAFEISFIPIKRDFLWKVPSHFSYKFWEEPTGLGMLGHFFVRLLPLALSYAVLLRRARARAEELVEMQAGRIRHDFEERLTKNAIHFRREMAERYRVADVRIEESISAGMQTRVLSEGDISSRRAELSDIDARIVRIRMKLEGHSAINV